MDAHRIRERFAIDDSVVSALPGDAADRTSQERYLAWTRTLDPARDLGVEYLLPRIRGRVRGEWPAFTTRRSGHLDLSPDELRRRVDELAPWTIPFPLAEGMSTMEAGLVATVAANRILYRRDLIGGSVAARLGNDIGRTSVLDIGCGCGFFSMDLAERGVASVEGIDLRPKNIGQARFVAQHYGVEKVDFQVGDVDALGSRKQWDVVVNLGVLYHVVNPLQFIRQTYELCRRFAVIDTVCHREPVSGYIVFGNKDIDRSGEGREEYELHPTYRGAIDTIRYAGFSEVIEIVGEGEFDHPLYTTGQRRCFLAIK